MREEKKMRKRREFDERWEWHVFALWNVITGHSVTYDGCFSQGSKDSFVAMTACENNVAISSSRMKREISKSWSTARLKVGRNWKAILNSTWVIHFIRAPSLSAGSSIFRPTVAQVPSHSPIIPLVQNLILLSRSRFSGISSLLSNPWPDNISPSNDFKWNDEKENNFHNIKGFRLTTWKKLNKISIYTGIEEKWTKIKNR